MMLIAKNADTVLAAAVGQSAAAIMAAKNAIHLGSANSLNQKTEMRTAPWQNDQKIKDAVKEYNQSFKRTANY